MANRRANVGLAPAALHATNTTPETSDQHGTHSLDIAGLRLSDDATEARDPVAAALGLILEKTLLSLSHENVARMLTVSKHWRQVIHDSIDLRRKLFLTPVQKREYLEWSYDLNVLRFGGTMRPKQVISQSPKGCGDLIIEAHPLILRLSTAEDSCKDGCAKINLQSLDVLKTVSPLTFISQPPIKYDADVSCGPHEERLRCRTGITFGAVVEACQKVVDACQKGVETVPDVRIFIFFGGLLAGATEVRVARQAQANAQRRT